MTDEPEIEAIPTTYSGTTFRSRLEARWATFLNSHHITWQYEPETVVLPSGSAYVPDFWLPELGTWIEVKGEGIPRIEKAIEFGQSRACGCEGDCICAWPGGELVLIGRPPKPYNPLRDPNLQGVHYIAAGNIARRHGGYPNWATTSGQTAWLGICPNCQRTGWFLSRYPIQCRACRTTPASGHLYAVIDPNLTFPKDIGSHVPVLPADPEREARLAERQAELAAYDDDSDEW